MISRCVLGNGGAQPGGADGPRNVGGSCCDTYICSCGVRVSLNYHDNTQGGVQSGVYVVTK